MQTFVFEGFRAVKTSLGPSPACTSMTFQPSALCRGTHRNVCWHTGMFADMQALEKSEPPKKIPPKHPQMLQGTMEVTRVVLSLLFQGGSRLLALKHIWGAASSLQEWRMERCHAGQRAQSRLLFWDDMLLYIPIWIRLLWNVRKCVVSGRHRQCPLLPATARIPKISCDLILLKFYFVK